MKGRSSEIYFIQIQSSEEYIENIWKLSKRKKMEYDIFKSAEKDVI